MEFLFPICYGLIGLFLAYVFLRLLAKKMHIDAVDVFIVGFVCITLWPGASVAVGLIYLCSFLCDHFNGVE